MWNDSKRSRNIFGVIDFWVVLLAANAAILSMLGCASGSTAAAPSQTPFITSSSSAVRIGESVSFSVTGSSSKGIWQVVGGTDNGQIDQNGVYTPPASLPQPNKVTVEYVQTQNALKAVLSVLNPKPTLTGVAPQQITASVTNLVIRGTGFVRSSQIVIGGTSMPTTMIDQSTLTTTVSFAPGTNTSVSVLVANPDPGVASSSSITVPVAIPNISVSPTSIAGGNVQLSLSGITSNPSDLLVKLDDRVFTVAPGTNASVSANGYLPPWYAGQAYLTVSSISTGKELAHFSLGIQPTAVSFDTAAHFLMQAGFGPRPDLVQHVQQIGLEAFIAEQQALPTEPYQNSMTMADIMKRAAFGNAPLRIKVAFALQSYIPRPGLSAQHSNAPFEVLMEKNSTGNYRDLMTDICSDPSLTMFLNLPGNAASTDPSNPPNQNFARELLQLFTLGTIALNDDGTAQLNADGSAAQVYDQDTIMNLSRVLTGWNNAPPQNPTFTFSGVDWSAPLVPTPSQHDYGAKRVLGTNIPAGLTPEQDRKMALDIIFAHPNMPPFISRILIQRLVKSNPSKDFVRRISNVFKEDGKGVRGNLAAVVRAILLDPEARAGDTTTGEMYGLLQSPYLFLTSVMGITGLSMTDLQASYIPCALKECVFYPSTVFGSFSPSYRIPGTNINAPEFQIFDNLTLVNRSQILWAMVTDNQPGMTRGSSAWLYTNFQTVPQLVDAINHLAYHGQMTQERQTAIVNAATQLGTDSVSAQNVALFLALNSDTYSVLQ